MPDKPDHQTQHGVPAGATKEESKGGSDSDRLESETAPLQPSTEKDK